MSIEMNTGLIGALYGGGTLLLMFSGTLIAFALGSIAVAFMFFFMPASSLDTVTQNVHEEMANITLLSILLFILNGIAIGKARVDADLYSAIHTWMQKIPGGLRRLSSFLASVVEVVKRTEQHKFVVLPKRWIVERTFAWLALCRRLNRDYEVKHQHTEAMVKIAMIRLLLKRLSLFLK